MTTIHMPPRQTALPPPDFDIHKVKANILDGKCIPQAWLPWVIELDFDFCTNFSNAESLVKFENLKMLSLGRTRISNATPLGKLNSLRWLFLNRTQIVNLNPLETLNHLKTLDLNETNVTEIIPLAGLSNLQEIRLGATQVKDIAPLAGLNELKSIEIWGTQVNDIIPLKTLPRLSCIEVETQERAEAFLPQLGEGWRVEKPKGGGRYELRRDVPSGRGG